MVIFPFAVSLDHIVHELCRNAMVRFETIVTTSNNDEEANHPNPPVWVERPGKLETKD